MAGGMYGADIEALRTLADRIAEGSQTLDGVVAAVETAIPGPESWGGPDAEGFRAEWGDTHLVRLRETASALTEVAGKVRDNADAQESTSNDYSGVPGGGGSENGTPGGGDGFDWGELGMIGLKSIGPVLAAVKAIKTGSALVSAVRAGGLAAGARSVYLAADGLVGATARGFGAANSYGLLGRLGGGALSPIFGSGAVQFAGQASRFIGGAGGALAIYDGVNRMFNTQYDGARGVMDRVMGGVGVVGGAGSIAIALGGAALLGPVGVGVVVGAGLAAGAWALGNMVWDAYGDEISAFASDATEWVGDTVGDAAEAVGDAAGDAVDAVGDALGDAGDFIGGLF
ncbi:hypothetical protein [Myceligenerans crystallogenes]|uniref:WXG100 family type VII secretion target n=1 Tax=Myceligenerans crystallogenes TaxID=316335 RepID=A0ABN2N2R7_9MICO